jgi:hypothetical protein
MELNMNVLIVTPTGEATTMQRMKNPIPEPRSDWSPLATPHQPARTSDNYLPVIAFYPNGVEMRTSTLIGREHHMEKAIEELSAGRHASVPLDEAERVRTWLLNHNANL